MLDSNLYKNVESKSNQRSLSEGRLRTFKTLLYELWEGYIRDPLCSLYYCITYKFVNVI